MRVLLLGGTGTLSSAVLKRALENGWNISVFNRGNNNKNIPSDVEIIKGDFKQIANCDKFRNATYDVVIDFLSRIPEDIDRSYPIFKNICKQYIFISSACVYRRAPSDFPIKETSPMPNSNWNYNVQKYECEKKLGSLSTDATSYYTIVRPYITYDDNRIPLGIAPAYKYHKTIIERIRSGKPMFVWDNGEAVSTITYTDDFARGLVGLFMNDKAKNQAFHIVSDYQYTGKQILLELYSALGKTPNIISVSSDKFCKLMPKYSDMIKGDRALDAKFDNSKIKDAVPGLTFEINIKEGLKRIVSHYESMTDAEYDYEFDAQMDRAAMKCGVKTKYIPYPSLQKPKRLKYLIFKLFPYKLAKKIGRFC